MAVIKLLLDTNTYTAFKRNHSDVCDLLRHAHTIALNAVILGELKAGFAFGGKETQNLQELEQFLAKPRIMQLPIDSQTAKHYALIYKQLRSKGQPIPTNDLWIAATARQHQLSVLTFDKHFKQIEGIKTVMNLQDFK